MNITFSQKKPSPKVKKKAHNPSYKDGYALVSEIPHELLLMDPGITLKERVEDLTRLSRIRRIRQNQQLAELDFDDEIDLDDIPLEGYSPYEIDGGEVGEFDPVSREPDTPSDQTNAEQSGEAANGGEATAKPEA